MRAVHGSQCIKLVSTCIVAFVHVKDSSVFAESTVMTYKNNYALIIYCFLKG